MKLMNKHAPQSNVRATTAEGNKRRSLNSQMNRRIVAANMSNINVQDYGVTNEE